MQIYTLTEEMKYIFKKAGVTEKELEDPFCKISFQTLTKAKKKKKKEKKIEEPNEQTNEKPNIVCIVIVFLLTKSKVIIFSFQFRLIQFFFLESF
jgi:hypothetical protein